MRFCLPLIAGNLLQQLYNVVDTWVVGRYLGEDALAAVGSSFSLLVLLTSVVLGLCMGSSVVFSQLWVQGRHEEMRRAMGNTLGLCTALCTLLTAAACLLLGLILGWLNVPGHVQPGMAVYLRTVLLAYAFAPMLGKIAIWWAISIGWAAADVIGLWLLRRVMRRWHDG